MKGDDKGDDDDDDDDDDSKMEKYMKSKKGMKYMKKMGYGHMKKADELSDSAEALLKATQGTDLEGVEAVIIDGTDLVKALVETNQSLLKAVIDLSDRLESVEGNIEYSTELQKATGEVLVENASVLQKAASVPDSRKSVLAGDAGVELPSSDKNGRLQKAEQTAARIGFPKAKQVVMKAAMDGNASAMKLVTKMESAFGNFNMLKAQDLVLIDVLAESEGKV